MVKNNVSPYQTGLKLILTQLTALTSSGLLKFDLPGS